MAISMISDNLKITEKKSVSIFEWIKIEFIIIFFIVLAAMLLQNNAAGYSLSKNLITLGFAAYLFKRIQYNFDDMREAGKRHISAAKESFLLSIRYIFFLTVLLSAALLIFVLFLKLSGLEKDFYFFTVESSALKKNLWDLNRFQFLLYVFSVSVLTPVAEEILFRRFFYVSLRKKLSFPAAAALNSSVFAFLHFPDLISVFLGGFFLCYVYEKEGNIFTNIMIHGIKNFLSVSLMFYTSSGT